MQTDKMKSTGNEKQKDQASSEKYSKRDGKHKKAGEEGRKDEEEEGTPNVWKFWKMQTARMK